MRNLIGGTVQCTRSGMLAFGGFARRGGFGDERPGPALRSQSRS